MKQLAVVIFLALMAGLATGVWVLVLDQRHEAACERSRKVREVEAVQLLIHTGPGSPPDTLLVQRGRYVENQLRRIGC